MVADYVNLSSPARCRYCGQVIYGKTGYWHYWDLETRSFLCTSIETINHPYHPKKDEPRRIRRTLWSFLTNS